MKSRKDNDEVDSILTTRMRSAGRLDERLFTLLYRAHVKKI
ncbi:hypothetical protein [Ohtaekwangia sp.]